MRHDRSRSELIDNPRNDGEQRLISSKNNEPINSI
jgi:hypothetical protein